MINHILKKLHYEINVTFSIIKLLSYEKTVMCSTINKYIDKRNSIHIQYEYPLNK